GGDDEGGRSGQPHGGRAAVGGVDKARDADHAGGEASDVKRAANQREGATRDAAATRFFARVRGIEERHACAAPRERVGGPRSGRSRADDRDVHRARLTCMVEVDTGRFTVGVFQDGAWATKGLAALTNAGLPRDALAIIAKESTETAALIERTLGAPGERMELAGVGTVLARGPIVDALQGAARDLAKLGLAGTMRRVGFQAHDGRIFETLTGRGGVLVAIRTEPRAADALAILHSYGGGNAAIGAWTGRR